MGVDPSGWKLLGSASFPTSRPRPLQISPEKGHPNSIITNPSRQSVPVAVVGLRFLLTTTQLASTMKKRNKDGEGGKGQKN